MGHSNFKGELLLHAVSLSCTEIHPDQMCVCVCLRESLQVVVVQRGPVFVVAINKASLFVRVCRADGEALKGQRISSQLAPLPGVVTTNQEGFELVMPDFCAFSQPGTSISTDRNSRLHTPYLCGRLHFQLQLNLRS